MRLGKWAGAKPHWLCCPESSPLSCPMRQAHVTSNLSCCPSGSTTVLSLGHTSPGPIIHSPKLNVPRYLVWGRVTIRQKGPLIATLAQSHGGLANLFSELLWQSEPLFLSSLLPLLESNTAVWQSTFPSFVSIGVPPEKYLSQPVPS